MILSAHLIDISTTSKSSFRKWVSALAAAGQQGRLASRAWVLGLLLAAGLQAAMETTLIISWVVVLTTRHNENEAVFIHSFIPSFSIPWAHSRPQALCHVLLSSPWTTPAESHPRLCQVTRAPPPVLLTCFSPQPRSGTSCAQEEPGSTLSQRHQASLPWVSLLPLPGTATTVLEHTEILK